MARFGHVDIISELVELCQETMGDIKQQLSYYRASVYKHETATQINQRIQLLMTVSTLINDDPLNECFHDFQAIEINGNSRAIPGECSFSSRVGHLMSSLEVQLKDIVDRVSRQHGNINPMELAKNVQKHRRELLGLCRHGSRQWSFFQTF